MVDVLYVYDWLGASISTETPEKLDSKMFVDWNETIYLIRSWSEWDFILILASIKSKLMDIMRTNQGSLPFNSKVL